MKKIKVENVKETSNKVFDKMKEFYENHKFEIGTFVGFAATTMLISMISDHSANVNEYHIEGNVNNYGLDKQEEPSEE